MGKKKIIIKKSKQEGRFVGVANANFTKLALHVLLLLLPSSMLFSSELHLDSSCLDLNPCPQDIKSLKTTKLATKFD